MEDISTHGETRETGMDDNSRLGTIFEDFDEDFGYDRTDTISADEDPQISREVVNTSTKTVVKSSPGRSLFKRASDLHLANESIRDRLNRREFSSALSLAIQKLPALFDSLSENLSDGGETDTDTGRRAIDVVSGTYSLLKRIELGTKVKTEKTRVRILTEQLLKKLDDNGAVDARVFEPPSDEIINAIRLRRLRLSETGLDERTDDFIIEDPSSDRQQIEELETTSESLKVVIDNLRRELDRQILRKKDYKKRLESTERSYIDAVRRSTDMNDENNDEIDSMNAIISNLHDTIYEMIHIRASFENNKAMIHGLYRELLSRSHDGLDISDVLERIEMAKDRISLESDVRSEIEIDLDATRGNAPLSPVDLARKLINRTILNVRTALGGGAGDGEETHYPQHSLSKPKHNLFRLVLKIREISRDITNRAMDNINRLADIAKESKSVRSAIDAKDKAIRLAKRASDIAIDANDKTRRLDKYDEEEEEEESEREAPRFSIDAKGKVRRLKESKAVKFAIDAKDKASRIAKENPKRLIAEVVAVVISILVGAVIAARIVLSRTSTIVRKTTYSAGKAIPGGTVLKELGKIASKVLAFFATNLWAFVLSIVVLIAAIMWYRKRG